MLAKSKLNSNGTLILDREISHEESKTIVNEKGKHEKMKDKQNNMNTSENTVNT